MSGWRIWELINLPYSCVSQYFTRYLWNIICRFSSNSPKSSIYVECSTAVGMIWISLKLFHDANFLAFKFIYVLLLHYLCLWAHIQPFKLNLDDHFTVSHSLSYNATKFTLWFSYHRKYWELLVCYNVFVNQCFAVHLSVKCPGICFF